MKTLWNADSLSITHYFTGRRATIIESALADQAWLTFLISASCWSVLFRLPFDLETRARLLGIRNTAAKRSSFDNSWPDAFALNRRTWLPLEHLALIRGSSSLRSFSHLKVRRRKSIIYIYIYMMPVMQTRRSRRSRRRRSIAREMRLFHGKTGPSGAHAEGTARPSRRA